MKISFENIKELLDIARHTQGKTRGGGFIPCLQANPGIGKTQIVQQYADSVDYALVTLIGARYAGPDFGLPVPNHETRELILYTTGRIVGRVPEAEGRKGVIVFLDECNNLTEDVQTVLLSLLEDRTWEDKPVDPNVIFVLAGNHPDTNCGSSALIQSLQDRLCTVNLEVDCDAWSEHAAANGVKPEVIAYNVWKEGRSLSAYDADAPGSQPSPRSWVKVSEALKSDPPSSVRREVVEGYVGEIEAAAYLGFEALTVGLQSTSEIVRDPQGADLHDDHSVVFAQVSNIISHVRAAGEKLDYPTTDALIEYIDRLDEFFSVLAFRLCTKANALFCESDEYGKFQAKHRGVGN